MISRNFAAALLSTAVVATDPHEAMKIAGIVEGFFIGAFDFHGMTDIGHCLGDVNPMEEHLENSMRGFWNGSYQEVTKAIDQMGLSVSDIGDMLDHCGKIDHHDYEQIQRMAEAFLHPKQLLLEATESIIINGVNIFEDVRESLHDYRMGHFLDSGEHFGQAAAMLLYGKTQMVEHEELFFDFDNHWQELLDQIDHEKDDKMHKFEAMKTSNVHFSFFRMGKILEGLLAGSVEAEVPHGVECLRDAKHIWERIGGVVDEFRHATFDSVLHSVEDLGAIINDVAGELEQCKATVGTDLDKLREMSKAFTNPWYFIFHVDHDLIINGQDVNHELMDAMAQWENQHYYEFGHSLGLALSKIFLGQQMSNGIPSNALPGFDENMVHYPVRGYDHAHGSPMSYDGPHSAHGYHGEHHYGSEHAFGGHGDHGFGHGFEHGAHGYGHGFYNNDEDNKFSLKGKFGDDKFKIVGKQDGMVGQDGHGIYNPEAARADGLHYGDSHFYGYHGFDGDRPLYEGHPFAQYGHDAHGFHGFDGERPLYERHHDYGYGPHGYGRTMAHGLYNEADEDNKFKFVAKDKQGDMFKFVKKDNETEEDGMFGADGHGVYHGDHGYGFPYGDHSYDAHGYGFGYGDHAYGVHGAATHGYAWDHAAPHGDNFHHEGFYGPHEAAHFYQ